MTSLDSKSAHESRRGEGGGEKLWKRSGLAEPAWYTGACLSCEDGTRNLRTEKCHGSGWRLSGRNSIAVKDVITVVSRFG